MNIGLTAETLQLRRTYRNKFFFLATLYQRDTSCVSVSLCCKSY